ncbi:MAG: SCO family protein [Armatimonadota bacterium]|jgi:protein SCO1/2|nr:SCO family protein [Fimbriimonadaceae bacterium]MCZ8139726.1 SCO family protein [Fimbriimonadaceae bacterium]
MRNFVTAILLLVTAISAAQFYGYKDQPVPGQSRVPAEAAGEMRIEQKLGAMVPKDVRLVNEEGRTVRLEELLGKKPTILTFVFYDCTSVCLDILFNLTKELKGLKTQEIGREYRVITVSIKPTETPAHARSAKIRTLEGYPANRRTAMTEDGWHFLVGDETEVRRLADSVGFKYTYDAKSDNVVHPAGIIVLSPAGNVSRYFVTTEYSAFMIREALATANEGRMGPRDERPFYLACIDIDPLTGARSLNIMNTLKVFGLLTVLSLALFITTSLIKERRALKRGTE